MLCPSAVQSSEGGSAEPCWLPCLVRAVIQLCVTASMLWGEEQSRQHQYAAAASLALLQGWGYKPVSS